PARTRQYLRSLFERLRSMTARLDELELDRAAPPAPPVPEMPPVPAAAVVVKPGRLTPAELPTPPDPLAGWVVVVHPLTRKAAETLPDEGLLATRFPLRIGRAASAKEREALDLNDLWLLDTEPFNVSRNHCEIYLDHEGPAVRDRGSHLGCGVNESRIGGKTLMGHARLEPGDNVLVVGSRSSPYQFRVNVSRA
ncbi:MAG TPA: FHA domain-containing protein, partial [Gemmata sp.]|nr:FHA domain-containing protein [Gemmata sp.]